jgi:hypothetical protein
MKRLFVDRKTSAKERLKIVNWAAENKYEALVFSLNDRFFGRRNNAEYVKLAKRCAFLIETGGRDFSLLLPRKLFLFHRDFFRMELGKRKPDHHFCPTNPAVTSRITERTHYLFSRVMTYMAVPRIFHLLPDEGQENTWCACPACRAFTPAEQNLIAVNTAADALATLDPDAKLSFFDYGTEPETADLQIRGIKPRENTFKLSSPPPG